MKHDKKGIINVVDLLLTFFMIAFLLLFVNIKLDGGVGTSHEKSLENHAEFRVKDSAVRNLYIQIQEGKDIAPEKVDFLVLASEQIDGRTITTCSDYVEKSLCESDPVNVASSCSWDAEEEECD